MPGLGGGRPCRGELGLNLRSQHQGVGLGRSPLGGTGVSAVPFSLAGFSHLPSGLYPPYLHLSHLEPPSSGSPLLSQLGQPSIFDTQKGQRAGVVGRLGGGLWNGVGGNHYPSTPDCTLAVFPKTPAPGSQGHPWPSGTS